MTKLKATVGFVVFFAPAIAAALVLLPVSTAFAQPHGGFTAITEKCYQCHVVHTASAETQLLFPRGATPKELCYTCHDGTGASTDIRSQFGESGESVESSHPVAAGVLSCSDCHTPHKGPEEGNPRSLAVGASLESTGNDVCGVCHGPGSTLRGGDLLTSFTGSAHDTSTTPPPSGTQIKCGACHVPHGSENAALIPTAVVGASGTTHTVSVTTTSGPRPFCEACHDVARGGYKGPETYASSKHATVTTSTVASVIPSGTPGPAGDCSNCHAPHGGATPYMLRLAGNAVCQACHDSAEASYPARYSYRGSSVMSSTPHASIETTNADGSTDSSGCAVCHNPHGGARSWDDTLVAGSLNRDEGTLCTGGGVGGAGGCHAAAANSASGVSILDKFTEGPSALARHSVMASDQASAGGRIACSSCHDVHADTAVVKYSDPDSIEVTLTSGLSRFVDADGRVWAMVGAEHDGTAPVISNLVIDTSAGGDTPVFNWDTDENATTWLDWGTTTAYGIGSFGTDLPLTTSHSAAPTGVVATTEYHFRLRSADALGNERVSQDYLYKGDVTLSNDPTPNPVPDQYTGTDGTTVPLSWAPVTVSDGDTPQYYVEIWESSGVRRYTSGWITATSWTTPRLGMPFTSWTWRVVARDPIHINAASPWLYDSFIVDYWEAAPEAGSTTAAVVTASPSMAETAGLPAETFSASDTTTVPEPGVGGLTYSVDTDRVALEARSRDRAVVSYTPSTGWESSGLPVVMPTPIAPGTPIGGTALASATNADSSYWVTDLAAGDHEWNWQVVAFDLGADVLAKNSELALSWSGHGEPTAGYATRLWLWNRIAGVWEQVYTADAAGTDRDITTGITTSVTDVFCLKCHDGTTPEGVTMRAGVTTISPIWALATTSDFHGPRVGTGTNVSTGGLWAGYSRGAQVACAACHDPHGSASPYGLAQFINGINTNGLAGTNAVAAACYACHSGTAADWHSGCISCHDSIGVDPEDPHTRPTVDLSDAANCQDCHNHGSLTKWGTVGIVGAPGCGRGVSHSGGCHTWRTTF
jgi:predicted CXXCH cytochrome family protein